MLHTSRQAPSTAASRPRWGPSPQVGRLRQLLAAGGQKLTKAKQLREQPRPQPGPRPSGLTAHFLVYISMAARSKSSELQPRRGGRPSPLRRDGLALGPGPQLALLSRRDWNSRCPKWPKESLGAKNEGTKAVRSGASGEAALGKDRGAGDTEAARGEGDRQRRGNQAGAPPYRGGGFGPGPVLQQHVDDVRVALLRRLVQRCVAILGRKKGKRSASPESPCLGPPPGSRHPAHLMICAHRRLGTSAPECLAPCPCHSAWEMGCSEEHAPRPLPRGKEGINISDAWGTCRYCPSRQLTRPLCEARLCVTGLPGGTLARRRARGARVAPGRPLVVQGALQFRVLTSGPGDSAVPSACEDVHSGLAGRGLAGRRSSTAVVTWRPHWAPAGTTHSMNRCLLELALCHTLDLPATAPFCLYSHESEGAGPQQVFSK